MISNTSTASGRDRYRRERHGEGGHDADDQTADDDDAEIGQPAWPFRHRQFALRQHQLGQSHDCEDDEKHRKAECGFTDVGELHV